MTPISLKQGVWKKMTAMLKDCTFYIMWVNCCVCKCPLRPLLKVQKFTQELRRHVSGVLSSPMEVCVCVCVCVCVRSDIPDLSMQKGYRLALPCFSISFSHTRTRTH